MASCDMWSSEGYLSKSIFSFSVVMSSVERGLGGVESSGREMEETEEIEVVLLLRSPSAGSNIGEGEAVLLGVLVESTKCSRDMSSSTSTISSSLRKCPPWIGGMKLFHRPSIFPITNFNMNACVSAECNARISSVASLPTMCNTALSPPGWKGSHASVFTTWPSRIMIFRPSAMSPSICRRVRTLSFISCIARSRSQISDLKKLTS